MTYIVVNVENRITDTSILSLGCVEIVGHKLASLILQRNIFQHGILVNGTINIWLCLLTKIDGLGITTPFKVEDTCE